MVHFSWYFRYMEEAEHALWRAAGLTIAASDDDLRFPRVAATCEFRAPLRFEDEIEVEIRVEAIGSRSLRYSCRILRAEATVAEGTMTVACIRTSGTGAIDLPDHIVRALDRAPSA